MQIRPEKKFMPVWDLKGFFVLFFLKLYYLVTIDMKLTSQNVKADNILIVCTVCSAHSHCASRLFYISY